MELLCFTLNKHPTPSFKGALKDQLLKMLFSSFRVLAGNPNISEKCLHDIERGLVRVEGGLSLFLSEVCSCFIFWMAFSFIYFSLLQVWRSPETLELIWLILKPFKSLSLPFSQVCHNKSTILCSAISEKHCKAQYGSDNWNAVQDKIPYPPCPVRTPSSHNIKFKFI